MVVQMIGVGEQTGALDAMLGKIADFYEEEVDQAVANMLTLMEPVMILFLGTTVGVVMKLRIVKINGAPFEAADAIVRALAGVLSFAAVGIGVLWILRSDDLAPDGQPARQGWHDKAVGTWVIKD